MKKLVLHAGLVLVALATVVSTVFGAWEEITCNPTETWAGPPPVECDIFWCVNDEYAWYICDGIPTSKECEGGCHDT